MFKAEFLRVIKTPINWLFSVVFPIVLIIIFGLLLGREYLHYGLMGIILLISLAGTIIPISIYFCSDKIEKRIKHYLIIQGAIKRYTLALYLVNLIIFTFVSFIIFLITILAFKVNIDYKAILMLLIFPIISYSLAFMIAIILGSLVTSINSIIPFSMLLFYLFLLLSGLIIPFQSLMAENQSFYYIEVLTPFGCLYMFYSHVVGSIELSTTKLLIAGFVILGWIGTLSYFLYLSLKTFKK
ncbi:ABC transporter permease [Spiroplasma endosymbiont of Dioctria linearis]|uniref:ABC transporter permease n=1 Tax=Spiroplasma endosymbiont of Dioctria linearis TaxID=3066290 RepID=UPI00313E3912